MYIVVIAWLFVALILAVSQTSVVAAVLCLAFWGLLPLGLVLWLLGTPERRRRAASRPTPHSGDPEPATQEKR